MLRLLAALAAGTVFGFGLTLSGMTDPAKVIGFLDIAGDWDPSLMFVLGSGVAVTFVGVRLARRLAKPVLEPRFDLPEPRPVDGSLVGGSALFGVGWGLVGFCPGPAVAALGLATWPAAVFVAAMAAGMLAARAFRRLMDRTSAAVTGRALRP